jgi:riboflavin synthase
MFTGIVEELGEVAALDERGHDAQLRVRCRSVVDDARPGDSIAVDGCCLTVTSVDGEGFVADVMPVTLALTTLGLRRSGAPVNLERAVRADGRLGGHVVQGHVDGIAEVVSITPGEQWSVVRLRVPAELARYVVARGSIALDGVSLTVSDVDAEVVTVSLIPETLARTTFGTRAVGDRVNVEVDVLAKYVERLLAERDPA